MNRVHISKYSKDGTLLYYHKKKPPSHMNVDFFMRHEAIEYGAPIVDGAVTMTVTDRRRSIEWVDMQGDYFKITHRIERRITYIELIFSEEKLIIYTRRGSRRQTIRNCAYTSIWVERYFSLLRNYVMVGRLEIKPSMGYTGIIFVPVANEGGQ